MLHGGAKCWTGAFLDCLNETGRLRVPARHTGGHSSEATRNQCIPSEVAARLPPTRMTLTLDQHRDGPTSRTCVKPGAIQVVESEPASRGRIRRAQVDSAEAKLASVSWCRATRRLVRRLGRLKRTASGLAGRPRVQCGLESPSL